MTNDSSPASSERTLEDELRDLALAHEDYEAFRVRAMEVIPPVLKAAAEEHLVEWYVDFRSRGREG